MGRRTVSLEAEVKRTGEIKLAEMGIAVSECLGGDRKAGRKRWATVAVGACAPLGSCAKGWLEQGRSVRQKQRA